MLSWNGNHHPLYTTRCSAVMKNFTIPSHMEPIIITLSFGRLLWTRFFFFLGFFSFEKFLINGKNENGINTFSHIPSYFWKRLPNFQKKNRHISTCTLERGHFLNQFFTFDDKSLLTCSHMTQHEKFGKEKIHCYGTWTSNKTENNTKKQKKSQKMVPAQK
jgi:hypothetical protein